MIIRVLTNEGNIDSNLKPINNNLFGHDKMGEFKNVANSKMSPTEYSKMSPSHNITKCRSTVNLKMSPPDLWKIKLRFYQFLRVIIIVMKVFAIHLVHCFHSLINFL